MPDETIICEGCGKKIFKGETVIKISSMSIGDIGDEKSNKCFQKQMDLCSLKCLDPVIFNRIQKKEYSGSSINDLAKVLAAGMFIATQHLNKK